MTWQIRDNAIQNKHRLLTSHWQFTDSIQSSRFAGSYKDHSPVLIPYPNYEMNTLPTNDEKAEEKIVSVFRPSVDACDRLWVIDVGAANGTIIGDPRMFIFDLNTDRLLRQFTITKQLRRMDGTTWFPGITVDVDPLACDQAFGYMPDIGWGLVVYSFQDHQAWRLEHNFFYFDPISSMFNFGDIRVEWQDGVFGLALSKRHPDGYRNLYFQSLASTRMFVVNTRVLQSNRSTTETFYEYRHLGHRSYGMQAASMALDEFTGVVLYALITQDAIGCWNPKRFKWLSVKTTDVVAQSRETLQFPADIKVDSSSNFWVLSDRMPIFRYRVHDFDYTDYNYRVMTAPVSELIKGTVCEPYSEIYKNTVKTSSIDPMVTQPQPTTQSTSINSEGWNFPEDYRHNVENN